MNKAIFLDRDGTINIDAGYVYRPQDIILIKNAAKGLKYLQECGFLLIVITNQSGTSYMFTRTTSSSGGNQAHNNMPPYLSVYMWKRVS